MPQQTRIETMFIIFYQNYISNNFVNFSYISFKHTAHVKLGKCRNLKQSPLPSNSYSSDLSIRNSYL